MGYIIAIFAILASIGVVFFQQDILSFRERIKDSRQKKREARYEMARAIQRLIVDAEGHLKVAQALSPEMYNDRVLERFRLALSEYKRHIHQNVVKASLAAIADIENHLKKRKPIQTEKLKNHFSSIQHRQRKYLRYGANGSKYNIF